MKGHQGQRVVAKQILSPVIPPTPSSTQKAGFLGLNPITGSACVTQLILPNVSQMKRRKLFKNFIDKFENVSFQKVGMDLKKSDFNSIKKQMLTKPPLPFAFTSGPNLWDNQLLYCLGTWCIIWTWQTSVYCAAHNFCWWKVQDQATTHLQRNGEADTTQGAAQVWQACDGTVSTQCMVRWRSNGTVDKDIMEAIREGGDSPGAGSTQSPEDGSHQAVA